MPDKEKQRVKKKPTLVTSPSKRQSYDSEAPIDIHARPVDYLTEPEVRKLIKGAKKSRNPERDALLILMLFRHGLRESEALQIRRDWVDLNRATIWIERLKGGQSSYHPLSGDELRMIRAYLRSRKDDLPWLFISERMSVMGSRNIRALVAKAAKNAELKHVHPHMLRHSCGFYLNNKGLSSRIIQDYLGHTNPSSTMIYTRTSAKQFEGLW